MPKSLIWIIQVRYYNTIQYNRHVNMLPYLKLSCHFKYGKMERQKYIKYLQNILPPILSYHIRNKNNNNHKTDKDSSSIISCSTHWYNQRCMLKLFPKLLISTMLLLGQTKRKLMPASPSSTIFLSSPCTLPMPTSELTIYFVCCRWNMPLF